MSRGGKPNLVDFHCSVRTIRAVVREGRAMLESNPSARTMAGQYPERLLRQPFIWMVRRYSLITSQRTLMMKQKLKVSFDNPEHGWVGLTISQGEESLTIIASYSPSDSFLDLTNTLYNLLCYRVGGIVTWHEEPAETEMRFSTSQDEVELEVYSFSDRRRDYGRGERELAVTGTYEEICVPFWRALRSLQGRFSAEELDARWHRPFPWKEIEILTATIKEKFA